MKSLNMIALVATVAVVSACSHDDKKGTILTNKNLGTVNRTADSKGKIPATSSNAELAAAKATIQPAKDAAPAAEPSLVDAAEASYKLLVEAGSQAFRKSLQESSGNEELSLAAAKDAIISKVNEMSAANPEAIALALVLIGDQKVSDAFYQGQADAEVAHLAKFNADEGKILNEISVKMKAVWDAKKSEAELAFANLTNEIATKTDEAKAMQTDLDIEHAKAEAEQNAHCISTTSTNLEANQKAIDALKLDLAAQKALVVEYKFLITQIDGVQAYVAGRIQAASSTAIPATTDAGEEMTPAAPEMAPELAPAPEVTPETPATGEEAAPEAPASEDDASNM